MSEEENLGQPLEMTGASLARPDKALELTLGWLGQGKLYTLLL